MAAPAEAVGAENGTVGSGGSAGTSASAPKHTTYLSKPRDIARVLKQLRDQRALLQLRFDGDPVGYTAKILDLEDDGFLIESLQPRDGLRHMRQGTVFSLSARAPGLYLHSGTNRVESEHAERSLPYFKIRIEGTVLYQQRRKAARFQLPKRVTTNGASITVFRAAHPDRPLKGRIIDISAGGCRAEFDSPALPPLEDNEQVQVSLEVPKLLELTATGNARHSRYDTELRKLRCGIELVKMHVTDRRRLEQFIESIRR
jgi:c-di-GMP-binding flagellar brake protein YcgR